MKKLFALILALVLLVPVSVSAAPSDYDVFPFYPQDISYAKDGNVYQAVTSLIQAGAADGAFEQMKGSASLHPDKEVTRAEFATLLVKAAGLKSDREGVAFTDVVPGWWYSDSIRIVSALGIMVGDAQGTFRPQASITRAEMAAVMVKAFGATVPALREHRSFPDVTVPWQIAYVEQAARMGIVSGYADGAFGPERKALRLHAMLMLNNALSLEASDVPADAELAALVRNHLNESYAAMNADNYAELADAIERNTRGFYYNASLFFADWNNTLESGGTKLRYELVGTPVTEVVSKSDRFAAVKVSGYTEKVSLTDKTGTTRTETLPKDDVLLLMKRDGRWFIYGSRAAYEELKDLLFATKP